jgi:hypothetical protein
VFLLERIEPKMNKKSLIVKFIMFFVTILPATLLGYLILKNSVNIPYMDDWDTPGAILAIGQGQIPPFADWFAQHNESRPMFPRFIFAILAYWTGWDLRYQMLLSFLFAGLIAVNVFYISHKTVQESPVKLLFLNSLANLLIFSPVTDNWLWGIQTIVFIPMACMTTYAAICYSNFKDTVKLLMGMALATVSTFSYSSGIVMWVVTIPFLFLSHGYSRPSRKRKQWFLGIWLAGFLANASLYFSNYHKPGYHPNFLEAVIYPFKALGFFFAFLGSPLGFSNIITNRLILSQVIGFILVLLFILVCVYLFKFRQNYSLLDRMIPWLVIASYTLLSGLMATAGRVGHGVEAALALRYITFSVYLGVALIYLMAIVFQDIKARNLRVPKRRFLVQLIPYSLTLTFLYFSLSSFAVAAESMTIQKQQRVYGKSCVLLINLFADITCIQTKIYPLDFDFTQDRTKLLSDLGFLKPKLVDSSLFQISEKQQENPINSHGFLDQFIPLNPDTYQATGWAIIPEQQKPADAVILTYKPSDDSVTPFAIVEVNQLRPDVARAFDQPNYRQSGWQVNFSTDQIPAQATEISAWSFDAETGKAYIIRSIPLNPSLDRQPKSIVGDSSVSPPSQETLKDLGNIKIILGYRYFAGLINQVNGSTEAEQTLTQNTPIPIMGWAVLPGQNQVPDQIILTVGNNYRIVAKTSVKIDRPDIAAQFNRPNLIQSGWMVELNPSIFTAKPMVLRAWAYDSTHQKVYRLHNTFKLQRK